MTTVKTDIRTRSELKAKTLSVPGIKQRPGIYVHIPFCEKKCDYCDFLSFDWLGIKERRQYFDALVEEIRCLSNHEFHVDSVFFGGGTPSVVEVEFIKLIMDQLRESFIIDKDTEISMEANPNTITANKLEAWLSSGVNRLSIGVQSTSEAVLQTLGRIHDRETVFSSYKDARFAGFENINIDLIFAVPEQTEEIWEQTMIEILTLRPEHISFYALEAEEGTPLFQRLKSGELTAIDETTDRGMYHKALELLNEAGYVHYEISNAAIAGYECRHNLKYWSMVDYLGFGLGAHSFAGGLRKSNTADFETYVSGDEGFLCDCHKNNENDNISEHMFLGLRKMGGVSAAEFSLRFGRDLYETYRTQIRDLTAAGLLESKAVPGDSYLCLTKKGIDVSNRVFVAFI